MTTVQVTLTGEYYAKLGMLLLSFLVLVSNTIDRRHCTVSNCNTSQNNIAISKHRLFFVVSKAKQIEGQKLSDLSLTLIPYFDHSNSLR